MLGMQVSQSTALHVRGSGFYPPNSEENLWRSKNFKIKKKKNEINKILKRKEKKQAEH